MPSFTENENWIAAKSIAIRCAGLSLLQESDLAKARLNSLQSLAIGLMSALTSKPTAGILGSSEMLMAVNKCRYVQSELLLMSELGDIDSGTADSLVQEAEVLFERLRDLVNQSLADKQKLMASRMSSLGLDLEQI